jgi:replicative DNA helicase
MINSINRAEYVEASILAKLFTNDAVYILTQVLIDDFSLQAHKKFYSICYDHYFRYGQLTKSILQDKAKIGGIFDYGTIESYIDSVSSESIQALVKELKDFARKRLQEEAMRKILMMTQDVTVSSDSINDEVYQKLRSWTDMQEAKAYTLSEVFDEIGTDTLGTRLHIGEYLLDEMYDTVGSHKRTTEVLMAYEKHGKTSYACMRCANYLKQGYTGAYFTFEGGREDIYYSMKPYIERSENLFIIDSCQTLEATVAKIWELKMRYDIDFIVIDYLQRINVTGIRYHEEVGRISTVSTELTNICQRENIFGLFLAQPRKPSEDLSGWKSFPTAESIYGSGQIAKDAYIITGLFRPRFAKGLTYRNTVTKEYAVQNHMGELCHQDSVFLRVLKQRRGITKMDTVQMIHTNNGLNVERRVFDNNGNWLKAE